MACGTPVLAFRCGAVPEILDDGITGLIVDMLKKLSSLCRGYWPWTAAPSAAF
jgi:hypothetical protein